MRERVLLIVAAPFAPWHGVSLRARHTAVALAALGYQVDLLALPGGTLPEMPGVRIARVGRVPFLAAAREGGEGTWWIYRALLLLRTMGMALGVRYRYVHGIDAAWPSAWLAARMCGARFVYERGEASSDARSSFGERFAMRRAAAVITADQSVVAQMRGLGRESRACLISDIPGTWQEDAAAARRDEARERLGMASTDTMITYVGSLRKYQGVDLVFNALPAVLQELGGARLVVVGGTAREVLRAQALLRQAEIDQAVTFLGRVPPDVLVAVLSASDIVVAPRGQGRRAPIKLLDYMLAGRAVVATDCAANRSVLTAECAILVPPTPSDFARAILTLAAEPQRRAAMGRAARGRVLNEFSFGAFQEGLRRCYTYVDLKTE